MQQETKAIIREGIEYGMKKLGKAIFVTIETVVMTMTNDILHKRVIFSTIFLSSMLREERVHSHRRSKGGK